MLLTLIRHSKTHPTADIPIPLWGLTEEGVALARKLSGHEIIKSIDVLYSSLQTKALETALILVKPNKIPIRTDENLTEISSFTRKFFDDAMHEENQKKFYGGEIDRIEGGESTAEALQRFQKSVERIINSESKNGLSNIGIVSHGNILSCFSTQFCARKPLEILQNLKMPDVAVLDWDTKQFIHFFGETAV